MVIARGINGDGHSLRSDGVHPIDPHRQIVRRGIGPLVEMEMEIEMEIEAVSAQKDGDIDIWAQSMQRAIRRRRRQ